MSALLRERGIATLDELITILVMGKEPSLSQQVVEALLNNETYFFRDRAPFDLLQRHALPELAKRARATKRLRIWSAGCSTGQEVYSLAMLFAEEPAAVGAAGRSTSSAPTSRRACVDRARDGIYSQFEVQRGLGINQMISWFEECADGWRAVEPLRKPVRFQVHNLLEPPPHPGEFDIVLCRNVLLYLSPEKKTLAFERLAGGDGRGRLADARRRRDGDRPDQQARRRRRTRAASTASSATVAAVEKRAGADRRAAVGGLTRTAIAVRHCARGLDCIDRPSPNFDERQAAGLDDRPPLYRHARLPRARSTG